MFHKQYFCHNKVQLMAVYCFYLVVYILRVSDGNLGNRLFLTPHDYT